nr:hypothetical protein Iba_chr02eCG9310 [Ipomoea batatas]
MSSHVDVAQIVDLKSSAKASDLFYLNGNDRLDRGFDFSLLLMDVFWLNDMDRFDNTSDRGFEVKCKVSDFSELKENDRFDRYMSSYPFGSWIRFQPAAFGCLLVERHGSVYKLGSSPSSLISKHEHMSYLVDVAQIVDLIKCKALDLFYSSRKFGFSSKLSDFFWLNDLDRFTSLVLVLHHSSASLVERHGSFGSRIWFQQQAFGDWFDKLGSIPSSLISMLG